MADKKKGVTGSNLLQLLESRLDNVVYRLGIASNRRQARQFVLHGHIKLNDRRVNIPSCLVRAGDVVSIKDGSRKNVIIEENMAKIEHRGMPSWVEMDVNTFSGKVLNLPVREDIELPVQEQLIVELYSK